MCNSRALNWAEYTLELDISLTHHSFTHSVQFTHPLHLPLHPLHFHSLNSLTLQLQLQLHLSQLYRLWTWTRSQCENVEMRRCEGGKFRFGGSKMHECQDSDHACQSWRVEGTRRSRVDECSVSDLETRSVTSEKLDFIVVRFGIPQVQIWHKRDRVSHLLDTSARYTKWHDAGRVYSRIHQ